LTNEEGYKLAPARKRANVFIALILSNLPLELMARNEVKQLSQYGVNMSHARFPEMMSVTSFILPETAWEPGSLLEFENQTGQQ
jgi:hypothetical protein